MKNISVYVMVVFLLWSCKTSQKENCVSVIPAPIYCEQHDGVYSISRKTLLQVAENDKEVFRTARMLSSTINTSTGISLKTVYSDIDDKSEGICFVNAGLPKEAYSISVTPKRILIEYGDGAGAFYGVQTLLQLLPAEIFSKVRVHGINPCVPCCNIEDAPRFKYRGMHLDVCLHFFNLDFLKRYVDIMSIHKVNIFHLHLTEDQGWRLEIKKYPLLAQEGQWRKETVVGSLNSGIYDGIPHGGYYTQEQMRELIEYAAERYVTIVPEIELPGHALAAISCYPELSCGLEDHYETATKWGVFRQVYCTKDKTFEFLEDVFDEVFELFPSKLVHIGGDECPKHSWKLCPQCQSVIKKYGLKDEYELQSWFVTRMEEYINSKGHEIIGWDEILQGGLAPNAKVMSWLGEEGGIKAAKQHHEVVMAPYPKYYLDYWQADPDSEPLAMGGPTTLNTVYEYNPVPEELSPEERKYIIGVEGCVWTEYMATGEHVEYMAWPRMCAIAESGWSASDRKDWKSFTERLEVHLKRLSAYGVNYCDAFHEPFIETHPDTPADKVVTMSVDAPGAEIHYTLDGTEPLASSKKYDVPFVINRSQTVKAAAFRDGKRIGKIKTKNYN